MPGKKYLVTGAAGFIGSAVAARLALDGNEIITIDNLSTGYVQNVPPNVRLIKGGCQDPAIIKLLQGERLDGIFHIAGQSSGEISFDDPVYDLQTNTQSTLLLLDLARKTQCEKFVFASTMSVYGKQPDAAVAEGASTHPESFYGVGKLASEEYLRIFSRFGIATTALRLFNVYGPGQNLRNLRQGMVSIYLAQALADGQIHVKGAPDRFRDFIYIDDVVAAFVSAASRSATQPLVCNICSGRRTRIDELLKVMADFLPSPVPIKFEGTTPGDLFGIFGSNELAKQELGWMPTVTLESGLNKMCDWARNGSAK